MTQHSLFDPPDSHQLTQEPPEKATDEPIGIVAPSGQGEPHSELDAERRRSHQSLEDYLAGVK